MPPTPSKDLSALYAGLQLTARPHVAEQWLANHNHFARIAQLLRSLPKTAEKKAASK